MKSQPVVSQKTFLPPVTYKIASSFFFCNLVLIQVFQYLESIFFENTFFIDIVGAIVFVRKYTTYKNNCAK